MSIQYDQYLIQHKSNVAQGFHWMQENIPEVVSNVNGLEWQICMNHDFTKDNKDEYEAYDKYFYGGNRSYAVVQDFRRAWLTHIHKNPHHWQHWVLINDDPEEGTIVMDMPYIYIVEMICDWWAFSWSKGDLKEIFAWYEKHEKYMKLSDATRKSVNDILGKIREKLEVANVNN